MKLKNLTIAIAMASLTATSFAAQAETKTSYYGSIRVGGSYNTTDNPDGSSDDVTKLQNWASRMGFKGETDLENGMTAFGTYEFGVDTDSGDNGNGALSTRKAYVGLKGNFGRVRIGQDYHSFYNTVIAPTDIAWWGSCNGTCGNGTYTSRTGEALTFDSEIGPVALSTTSYMGDDSLGDGFEIGAAFDAGPVTLGIGAQDTDGNTGTAYGVSAKGSFNSFGYGVTYTDHDGTGSAFDVHLSFADFYTTFGQSDLDTGTKPGGLTLGYTHSIGKQTTAWFEASQFDDDAGTESTTVRAALKYDF